MKVCENNIKSLHFSLLLKEMPAECPAPLLTVPTVQAVGTRGAAGLAESPRCAAATRGVQGLTAGTPSALGFVAQRPLRA